MNDSKDAMIIIRPLLAAMIALLGAFGVHAQGILIWSADHLADRSWPPGDSWEIAFDHVPEFVVYPPSQNPETRIFPMTLGTNDAGRTFVANALNEPGFVGFVAGLTDGTNGYVRFQDGEPAVVVRQLEQLFLGRSSATPDLADYDITQINFRVNEFYDYYDVLEGRNFRTLDYSLDFYGAPVPEPSTWALLGVGGAAALFLRRKVCRRG
jgi:hypothetical protein